MSKKITNDQQALTLALSLAVTAPTDEQAELALQVAHSLQKRMTLAQVESAVEAAEAQVGAYARLAAGTTS